MKHKLSHRQRTNVRFIMILLIMLLITLNIVLNAIDTNSKEQKILEENQEIVELTTYLIEDNDLDTAVVFLDHYKDSHHVDFSFHHPDGTLIYSSISSEITAYRTTIYASGTEYIFSIDNTHSITVDLLNQNIFYTNVTIIGISLILLITLLALNKKSSNKINRDVEYILHYIKKEQFLNKGFNYIEFEEIYNNILEYTKKIDVLNEQKHLSVTGLAHDIKTPLTIIKSFMNPYKDVTGSITREKCLKAIDRISRLAEHLQVDDYAGAFYEFNFSKLIQQEMQAYYSIFNHKGITIRLELEEKSNVRWNMKQARIVVDNLFSNAYYYSNANSKYTVTSKNMGDTLDIKLVSEGNPIKPEEFTAIFEKGYRSTMTKQLNDDGEGVGLYIIKILLLQIKGTIDISVDGRKNIFHITIPLHN